MANYPPYGYNTPQMAQGQPMLGPQGQPGYMPQQMQQMPQQHQQMAPEPRYIVRPVASEMEAVAANLRTRTRYPVCVSTSATGGTFRLLGRVWCAPDNRLSAIDGGEGV